MAASLTPTLTSKDFLNWIKGAMAVLFAKDGLKGLVGHENIDFQKHVLKTIYRQKGIPRGTTCSSCTTANLLACPTVGFCSKGKKCKKHDSKVPDKKPNQRCPNGLCSHIREAIKNEHRFNNPSWKNSDARKWCLDAFELSKCFMPPDGYSDKTCLEDTDFNGCLAVVINNKRFHWKMSVNLGSKTNICTEARIIGGIIRHWSNNVFSDQDLMKYIDVLITLLSDSSYLAADVKAKDAVNKLNLLKTNKLTIHDDDVTNLTVLIESFKTTLDDLQKVLLRDIKAHFKKHINDSVEVFDKIIQESVGKYQAELKAQTDRGKKELNAETEKGKTELKLQSKTEKDELQAQLEEGKGKLNSEVEKGKVELSDQTKQGKFEVNSKLEKGKSVLSAQTEQGKDELNSIFKKGKSELSAKTKQGMGELNAHTRKCADELKKQTSDCKDELSSHIAIGKNEVEAKTSQAINEIELRGQQVVEEIIRSDVLKPGNNDDLLFQEFKEELVRFYNEKESMIPASPLVEEYAIPLMKLYVQSPMSAFIKPNAFGQGQKSPEISPVSTYRKLFLNNDNVPYKNIYIEANAGLGKTSFTQNVAMTWCLAQNSNKSNISKKQQDDVDTLKCFDLLFLLHLRDFHSDDTCLLDGLIHKFVSKNLPSKDKFSKEFIGRILQNKTCLAILDGLDEWVHPETCTETPGIPHNNYRERCTQLTTTRPWKLSTMGLTPNLIDRHVEISTLDSDTYEELKANAVKILSENRDEEERNLTDFDKKVYLVKDISVNPYILLQLICIWFDGLSIGESKCETYGNIIELTLQRGLNKKNAPSLRTGDTERKVTVPECMRHNATCIQYKDLLLKLGKLAFYALFQKIKESSLVIEITTVLTFLTEQELEFCLKIGLLSQSMDRSKVSVKRYKVFFQHKSVQEFMAAMYITSEWNDGSIKSAILEVCSSLSSILEMENQFVFVCGMNPEVYACVSGELQKIVDLDSSTCQYRTDVFIDCFHEAWKLTKSYQTMQLQCLQESLRNGNDSCPIPLYFGLDRDSLTYDVKALKSRMQLNENTGKSPQISLIIKIVASMLSENPPFVFMESLDPSVFTSMETLRVGDSHREPLWLADALIESARTLNHLTISGYISLSDISIRALTGLKCLQSLYLHHVRMTHSNLKCLYAYISQTSTLTQLKLVWIHCMDHSSLFPYCDFTFDIHNLNKLERLNLSLSMSSAAWQKLLLSVGGLPLPVTVELFECWGLSRQDWQTIVNKIKSTPTLSLISYDIRIGSLFGNVVASMSLKKQ